MAWVDGEFLVPVRFSIVVSTACFFFYCMTGFATKCLCVASTHSRFVTPHLGDTCFQSLVELCCKDTVFPFEV